MLVRRLMKVLSNLMGNGSKIKYTEVAIQRDNNNMNIKEYVDGVVESGSNTNGTYIKYADGTMICTKIVNAVASITNTWGSLYESGDVDLGDFPETFISKPIISVTNASDVGAGAIIEAVFGVSTTSAGKCWLCRGTSRATAVPYMLNIIAIGKWR